MVSGGQAGEEGRQGRRVDWGGGQAGEEGRLGRRAGWGRGQAGEEGRLGRCVVTAMPAMCVYLRPPQLWLVIH